MLHSAALCVVFDSIFGDLRLEKVKFNANSEWQYTNNFKELQSQLIHPSPGLSYVCYVFLGHSQDKLREVDVPY